VSLPTNPGSITQEREKVLPFHPLSIGEEDATIPEELMTEANALSSYALGPDGTPAHQKPLHPTPFTLHATPYTLHPTPYNLYLTEANALSS